MTKIKAELIELHVRGFSTQKDKQEFDKFYKGLSGFLDGIEITSYYRDGELMSFMVDSKRAVRLIKDREVKGE